MKTKLKNHLMIGICLLFLSVSINAQMGNSEVLSKIENPKMYQTIDLVQMDRNLTTFASLIKLSGLDTSMEFAKDHTVLAPTNDAFMQMSIDKFANLTNPKNKTDLIKFVKHHIIPNKVMSYTLKENDIVDLNNEKVIAIDSETNLLTIGGANVIKADVEASNGIIHVVDNVVVPTTNVVFGYD